jgi:hypothetical protein
MIAGHSPNLRISGIFDKAMPFILLNRQEIAKIDGCFRGKICNTERQ